MRRHDDDDDRVHLTQLADQEEQEEEEENIGRRHRDQQEMTQIVHFQHNRLTDVDGASVAFIDYSSSNRVSRLMLFIDQLFITKRNIILLIE